MNSIIPSMIFGSVLIIGWVPVIIMTEMNNKGNNDEYKLLLDKLEKTTFTDVTNQVFFSNIISLSNISDLPPSLQTLNIDSKINNNVYITYIKNTIITDSKGNKNTNFDTIKEIIKNQVLINNIRIDDDNYKYLVMQNNIYSDTVIDTNDTNISYDVKVYSIPINKQYIKIEGLKEFKNELDMNIYDYEFGPKDNAILAIKNRKKTDDTVQLWLGRIGTFLMLFIGLSLLISPLTAIVQLGSTLPGLLKLIILPGKIILSIYNTLSFFGSLLLTLIMTFLIWTIINKPNISILVASLLVGLIIFFNK